MICEIIPQSPAVLTPIPSHSERSSSTMNIHAKMVVLNNVSNFQNLENADDVSI
jgi:hypothetical protein